MNKLDAAIHVYRLFEEKSINGRQVTGILSKKDYKNCKDELQKFDLILNVKDETREIEFNLPSESDALFAKDMDDLLIAPSRLLSLPKNFYLADIDYFFSGESESLPDLVRGYMDASKFASTLNNISDHSLPLVPKAIFLQGEKLELSLTYSSSDLVILEGLDKFILDFVEAEIHKDQKATIIKGVLIEMLKNNEIDRLTVSCLMKRFSEFLERVNANYQLYVSEFSFEKIKEQVESEKFEFTLKLNKVFSDIQNQLLAIPIALVLVSSQMKLANGLSFINMSIWCGVLIFGIFMSLLIRNQRSTLNAIKLEIGSQWNSIQDKHKFVANRLSANYSYLKSRQKTQERFLFLVSLIVSLSIAVSTVLLLYNSQSLHLYKDVLRYGFIGGVIYLLLSLIWRVVNIRLLKEKTQN
ncbi:hypothetical protein [Teredinibacter haidensis]|uniref:hypothetical protein n=1 Tax=Teredinibacter haidensis TaxID=2731755 RepID=UPI00111516C3|nr:hypothetical protein [Teredinibacter haidensis]